MKADFVEQLVVRPDCVWFTFAGADHALKYDDVQKDVPKRMSRYCFLPHQVRGAPPDRHSPKYLVEPFPLGEGFQLDAAEPDTSAKVLLSYFGRGMYLKLPVLTKS
jgi:hypothetical protein